MEKFEFKSESKKMLDLMINSIYTNKEIFLRELISNASDAIDKFYYKSLKDEDIEFNRDDFYILLEIDEENREFRIKDTGIGMTKDELEENLGVIAKSGSLAFKSENKMDEDVDIIGQFGVGFYSAFMIADEVAVVSRPYGQKEAYKWESSGPDGFTIEETSKEDIGTEIILKLKDDDEEYEYSEFLNEYRIRSIVKKYSDFIRYPIKMEVTKTRLKEGSEDEYEDYKELETLNSMVPIWRKNKNELEEEDYHNFYRDKHFGFDEPLSHIHFSVDGHMSYRALLYIPKEAAFDFYTPDFEKGLELYSSGVMIMEKCSDLLPDHFSFVKGIVDSEDLTLNISRETLQNDRQLQLIGKRIEEKIKEELERLLKNNREDYEVFYNSFGKQLKFGAYNDFGMNKETLEDLLLFYSSEEMKLVSLSEYVERMKDDQEYIYYASGDSIERIDKLPQTELVKDKGFEILYLDEEIDEFAIKVLSEYNGKMFKSVSDEDLDLGDEESEKEAEKLKEENKDMFDEMKEILGEKVIDVVPSNRLKDHPVVLVSKGELSIEMEKVLRGIEGNQGIRADKVLEINTEIDSFSKLKNVFEEDRELFRIYTEILYDQASLVEGLEIDDPVRFAKNISKLM